MIRLLVVSDIKLYREGLSEIIGRNKEVQVVSAASNVEQAIERINEYTPDVVLIDMTMTSCIDVINHISSSFPEIKIVALSVPEDEDTILACAKAGISGYVSRDASVEKLLNTILVVQQGELCCPKRIAVSLFQKLGSLDTRKRPIAVKRQFPAKDSGLSLLTQREKQIAEQLTNGLSNKQIARNLSIEISTVKNHVHNILVKMGAESRLQAANILIQNHI